MRISDWSSDVCSSDLRIIAGLLAWCHHPEHAADPDHGIGGGRQPRFVAGFYRQVQRRVLLGFGLTHRPAHPRAFRGDGQLHHLTGHALSTGDINSIGRASGRERGGTDGWIQVVAVSINKKTNTDIPTISI